MRPTKELEFVDGNWWPDFGCWEWDQKASKTCRQGLIVIHSGTQPDGQRFDRQVSVKQCAGSWDKAKQLAIELSYMFREGIDKREIDARRKALGCPVRKIRWRFWSTKPGMYYCSLEPTSHRWTKGVRQLQGCRPEEKGARPNFPIFGEFCLFGRPNMACLHLEFSWIFCCCLVFRSRRQRVPPRRRHGENTGSKKTNSQQLALVPE